MGILEVNRARLLLKSNSIMQNALCKAIKTSIPCSSLNNANVMQLGRYFSYGVQRNTNTFQCDGNKSNQARHHVIKMENWFDCHDLDSLTRKELQKLCKRFKLRANVKTEQLISNLREFHKDTVCDPTSILHTPFIPCSGHSSRSYIKSDPRLSRLGTKLTGIFTPLSISAPSKARDEELMHIRKITGARTNSTIPDNYLQELEKSVNGIGEAITVQKDDLFLKDQPGVSSVLSKGGQNKTIAVCQWRKKNIEKMGKEAFEKYQKDKFLKGKLFHRYLQDYFSSSSSNEDFSKAEGCIESAKLILSDISSVIACEKKVAHYNLGYRGTFDMYAMYRGVPCLIEWKTTEKVKEFLTDCNDSPLQLAAYAGAINSSPHVNQPITNGLIVITYHDGTPAHAHKMDLKTCEYYWQQWLMTVLNYRQKQLNHEI